MQVSLPNVSSAEGVSRANVVTVLEGGKDAEATSAYTREKCSGPKCKNRSLQYLGMLAAMIFLAARQIILV